jgi:hypothetical protein
MLVETLTPEQFDANNRRKESLIEFIRSGESILMAGAGCSGNLYPPWPDFVELLKNEALSHDPAFTSDSVDFLDFADDVKACLGNDMYYALISTTFAPGNQPHEQHHEILCRLPFRGITTTNYDMVLESALTAIKPYPNYSLHFEGTAKVEIHKYLMSLNYNKNLPKRVAHLHGVYSQQASIVLSRSEYEEKYGFSIVNQSDTFYDKIKGEMTKDEFKQALVTYGYQWTLGRKLLWSLLATRRVIFLGFGMSDPYFKQMLEFVKDDVGTYYSESHFLVLRVTKNSHQSSMDFSERLKHNYGIQTVFYYDDENDYSGLSKFISELDVINEPLPAVSKIADEVVAESKSGNKDLTSRLLEIAKKQNSDEN